jgi:RNA ligase (TIGR02306 family)
MSEYKICFSKIVEIQPHPNPEVLRLEIATVYGFNVVVQKGKYTVGDFALYVPVDSILDPLFESIFLGPNPKIKFDKHRVRQARIQKFASQGLLVPVEVVQEYLKLKYQAKHDYDLKLETDYQTLLNISKYEPPTPDFQNTPGQKKERKANLDNTNFTPYRGLDNIKWFPLMFKEGERVVIQEKLHGSNCRAGLVPTETNTFFKKIKKFFGLLPKFEYVYGSNNVELTNRVGYKGYYGENVYGKVLEKVNAFEKIRENEIVYGELIGEGIQKNYTYGHKEHHFVLFDVKILQADGSFKWLSPEETKAYAKDRGFDFVPVLYDGPYNKQLAYELTKGDSVYCPTQKIREGVVIKSADGYNDEHCSSKKKSLKWVSEAYLDKDQTDFH